MIKSTRILSAVFVSVGLILPNLGNANPDLYIEQAVRAKSGTHDNPYLTPVNTSITAWSKDSTIYFNDEVINSIDNTASRHRDSLFLHYIPSNLTKPTEPRKPVIFPTPDELAEYYAALEQYNIDLATYNAKVFLIQEARDDYEYAEKSVENYEVTADNNGSTSIQNLSFDPNINDALIVALKQDFFTDFLDQFIIDELAKPHGTPLILDFVNNLNEKDLLKDSGWIRDLFTLDLGFSNTRLNQWDVDTHPLPAYEDNSATLFANVMLRDIGTTADLTVHYKTIKVTWHQWWIFWYPKFQTVWAKKYKSIPIYSTGMLGLDIKTDITLTPQTDLNKLPLVSPRNILITPSIHTGSFFDQVFEFLWPAIGWLTDIAGNILNTVFKPIANLPGNNAHETVEIIIKDGITDVLKDVRPVFEIEEQKIGGNLSSATSNNNELILGISAHIDLNTNGDYSYARRVLPVNLEPDEIFESSNTYIALHANLINGALAEARSFLPSEFSVDTADLLPESIDLFGISFRFSDILKKASLTATYENSPYLQPNGNGYVLKAGAHLTTDPSVESAGAIIESFGIIAEGVRTRLKIEVDTFIFGVQEFSLTTSFTAALGTDAPVLDIYNIDNQIPFLGDDLIEELLRPLINELTNNVNLHLGKLPRVVIGGNALFVEQNTMLESDQVNNDVMSRSISASEEANSNISFGLQ